MKQGLSNKRQRRLSQNQVRALDAAGETVQRAVDNSSKQPRFDRPDAGGFYSRVYEWINTADLEAPPYQTDSRNRDEWLRKFWKREPHWAGVLNSIIAVDKNRGWTLSGGRNQVNRYRAILSNYENGRGWRYGIGLASNAYYTADIGAIVENGRDGEDGPLRDLYSVDPARCTLSSNPDYPLIYYPTDIVSYGAAGQNWRGSDFFRVASMINTDERFNGLGFCATSRVLEIAKTMIAVYMHDQEKLSARAPRGLLLLKGISQEQWDTAMQARSERLDALEQQYYGAVAVLASEMDDIAATLVALSNLPDNFDLETFTSLTMYAYALCVGYDPREFWPVSGGQLGSATESEVQHRKATGKGGMDFILGYQEGIQHQLPASIDFQFQQRDAQGELLDADVAVAKTAAVTAMYESGLMQGEPLITREEARILLAESSLIPDAWTNYDEDIEATDAGLERIMRIVESPAIQRALADKPGEPIYSYTWPLNTMRQIWPLPPKRRAAALRRRAVQRQDESAVLYDGDDFTITEQDVDGAIAAARKRVGDEFADLLIAEPGE